MSGQIRHEGRDEGWAHPIHRALLRDTRLSFGARGLFAFLWDLPGGWIIRRNHLAMMGPEGLDAISSRLKELMRVGAIYIEPIREDKDGNPISGGRIAGKRWVIVTPRRWAVEAPLASENRPKADSTESGITPQSALPTVGKSAAKGLQGFKGVQAEAAPRAQARGTADAAAPSSGKKRINRSSGIVVWLPTDSPEDAEKIEQQHDAATITAAVAAVKANGKHPVPGLVLAEIERQQLRQEAGQRRATAEAAYQARLQSQPTVSDLAARERGDRLLSSIRQRRDQEPADGQAR